MFMIHSENEKGSSRAVRSSLCCFQKCGLSSGVRRDICCKMSNMVFKGWKTATYCL